MPGKKRTHRDYDDVGAPPQPQRRAKYKKVNRPMRSAQAAATATNGANYHEQSHDKTDSTSVKNGVSALPTDTAVMTAVNETSSGASSPAN